MCKSYICLNFRPKKYFQDDSTVHFLTGQFYIPDNPTFPDNI